MYKRIVFILLALCLAIPLANCEEFSDWSNSPVITQAYELSSGKLYLEWQGKAPIYQIYMDGESVANVIVNNATISLKNGTHTISIYPMNEMKTADTKVDLGFNAKLIGGSFGLDLAALGLDPKKLIVGDASDSLNIDYSTDPIFNAVPDKITAKTDFDNRVHLSFIDRYNADEYKIMIKTGNDVNYVRFNTFSEDAAPFFSKENNNVTVILDQDYLQKQGCMIPEINEKYSFTVQLRKYAINLLNGEKETATIHESKISNNYQYTPTALWKTAPIITYASQISDGEIALRWIHDDNDLGCEYNILKINKTLGIKTGEEYLGATKEKEFIIHDLMNGAYCLSVMPLYNGEKGNTSNEMTVDVKNDWVIAPTLFCKQIEKNQVKLSWSASSNVEVYHITVYAGNNDSLLRYVDLDYSKYTELDLPVERSDMEYIFTYSDEYNSENGQKLKFEIYGVRHSANGTEQKSATSTQIITIK